jgi:hypothetical protein
LATNAEPGVPIAERAGDQQPITIRQYRVEHHDIRLHRGDQRSRLRPEPGVPNNLDIGMPSHQPEHPVPRQRVTVDHDDPNPIPHDDASP